MAYRVLNWNSHSSLEPVVPMKSEGGHGKGWERVHLFVLNFQEPHFMLSAHSAGFMSVGR